MIRKKDTTVVMNKLKSDALQFSRKVMIINIVGFTRGSLHYYPFEFPGPWDFDDFLCPSKIDMDEDFKTSVLGNDKACHYEQEYKIQLQGTLYFSVSDLNSIKYWIAEPEISEPLCLLDLFSESWGIYAYGCREKKQGWITTKKCHLFSWDIGFW